MERAGARLRVQRRRCAIDDLPRGLARRSAGQAAVRALRRALRARAHRRATRQKPSARRASSAARVVLKILSSRDHAQERRRRRGRQRRRRTRSARGSSAMARRGRATRRRAAAALPGAGDGERRHRADPRHAPRPARHGHPARHGRRHGGAVQGHDDAPAAAAGGLGARRSRWRMVRELKTWPLLDGFRGRPRATSTRWSRPSSPFSQMAARWATGWSRPRSTRSSCCPRGRACAPPTASSCSRPDPHPQQKGDKP